MDGCRWMDDRQMTADEVAIADRGADNGAGGIGRTDLDTDGKGAEGEMDCRRWMMQVQTEEGRDVPRVIG
ncbi:hypothetical protein ACLOJK_036885 [Asimina triloba]